MTDRINKKQLADLIGKSQPYISKLVKDGKLVFDSDGLILQDKALHELNQIQQRFKVSKVKSVKSTADTNELMKHKTKYEKWRADREELEFAKEKKLVIPRAELEQDAQEIANNLKAQMLAIPERLCHILAAEPEPSVVREKMLKEIKNVLTELSDKLEERLDGEDTEK